MRRPFSVTILLYLVLCLTAWSGLRLVSTIQWWGTLDEYAAPAGPVYIAITGGAWLVAGAGLLWGMWQAKSWIRVALLGVGAGFDAWYWCDRLLLQTPRANWPFALGATFLLLILVIICIAHPGTKEYFIKRERHGQ